MEQMKNLCAQIPLELHAQICEAKGEMTMNQYITTLLRTYYSLLYTKRKGGSTMENNRTMAFQIPEELFQRIKAHLERETARTGKKLTQRDFVLGLIEQALNEAEAQVSAAEVPPAGTTPQENA